MKLPRLLEDEIIKSLHRKGIISSLEEAQDLDLIVDDSYSHFGMSGAEIQRVEVTGFKDSSKSRLSLVVKPWESTKWLTKLLGVERPLENILFENGFFDKVNGIEGFYIPIIGSVKVENKAWIIMEDVTDELTAWKTAAFDTFDMDLEFELLDRIAFFHVKQEINHGNSLKFIQMQLVPQERRLRWFEQLCQEWFGSTAPADSDSPELQNTPQKSQLLREVFIPFLERLPKKERINWQNHMQQRNGLVIEAAKLPVTFLHGDLLWKNIGLRQGPSGNTFVLIDWEIATLGNHAFDVYYFISEPFRTVNVWDELFDHYFERYLIHGGRELNRDQWHRGVELAIAHYGLSWLPLFAELTRKGNDVNLINMAENIIDRTSQALHSVPL